MTNKNKERYISILIIFFGVLSAFGYYKYTVYAQGVSTATLIGGTTLGATGVCCDGIKLGFFSVKPQNIFILSGEALWTPGLSRTFDHYNQTSAGYCSLGKLLPAVCFTIASECTVSEPIPLITLLGTGGSSCALGLIQ